MNERIRELAQAAGLGFHGESITMLRDELPETVLGRFAELIVKECEKVSLKNSHRNDDMGAIIARQISKHFGVNDES